MKKLSILMLAVTLGSAHAQSPGGRRRPVGIRRPAAQRPAPPVESARPVPARPTPTFLSRRGAASISEMVSEPPTFSYGSSINVWLLTGEDGQIREVGVTGHGDSPTCRRVSGQVMGMFIGKEREPDDLFVAGAAHMVDRGDKEAKLRLEELPVVQEYIKVKDEFDSKEALLELSLIRPREGEGGQSELERLRGEIEALQGRLAEMRGNENVAAYLRETRSADALYAFAREVEEFAQDNGLVTVREIPLALVEAARARIAAAVASGKGAVLSFEDLLAKEDIHEAALFTPLLTVPGGRPVELRIPLARIAAANFEEARRSNRDAVEQAIVGNARQRLVVFNKSKKDYLEQQAECRTYTPEQLREIIYLTEAVSPEGVPYKLDKPKPMTRETYCKVKIPLNLKLVNGWIDNTKELLKSIDEDKELATGSRLEEFNNSTLIDSMLRDWRLPVARSQAAFDAWRGVARGPAWDALGAQLAHLGIAPNAIGGEQMIFSVQVVGPEVIVRPLHVIDMARSVVIIDPSAGVTRVLDAWSLRSSVPDVAAGGTANVDELVRTAAARLAAHDREGARAQLAEAFSIDPGAAFREVERTWLNLFPDTHRSLVEIQRSLRPVVEAAEWHEAFDRLAEDPAAKESLEEFISAYESMLESYPKMPVDYHLDLALILAERVASYENARAVGPLALRPRVTAWSVIQTFAEGTSGARRQVSPGALQAWRTQIATALRREGLRGERLTRQLALLENIELNGGDNFITGRKIVALDIRDDPAPLIQKAVQTVKQRDPAYWAAAVQVAGRPQERSREWQEADQVVKRVLTLFEGSAQSLARAEDSLRKSYWGAQAADYLWSSRNPDLKRLLPVIDAAVGDGSTGSSSAYIGPRSRVDFFIKQGRPMDTLTRAQNASSLQSGSEALLAIARYRITQTDMVEPFRDAIPLRARVWFESGNYLKSLETLLVERVPLALYHPDIKWQALPADASRKPLSVKARREGGRVLFAATFEQGGKADVLAVDGLSAEEADALVGDFNGIEEPLWVDFGKVSDQILMSQVPVRPAVREMRMLLLGSGLRLPIMKSMVYGRSGPGEDLIKSSSAVPALERAVAVTDRVEGDQGHKQRVPTLDEVKRVAAAKIGLGN
jgi:tetratricopeptide (TPR) repeat protein